MRQVMIAIVAMLWAGACSGCGDASGRYPVNGKVLYRGEPAVGATVTFVRKGNSDRMKEHRSQGIVGDDGSFTLASPAGAGAAPGDYSVLVEWKEGAGAMKGRSPGINAPDRLNQRYLDPERPLLSATVEAKSNRLAPFELQ